MYKYKIHHTVYIDDNFVNFNYIDVRECANINTIMNTSTHTNKHLGTSHTDIGTV